MVAGGSEKRVYESKEIITCKESTIPHTSGIVSCNGWVHLVHWGAIVTR